MSYINGSSDHKIEDTETDTNFETEFGSVHQTVLKNYLGLVIIIILWVAIWSLADTFARSLLKKTGHKVLFMTTTIAISSFVLIKWFPEQLAL